MTPRAMTAAPSPQTLDRGDRALCPGQGDDSPTGADAGQAVVEREPARHQPAAREAFRGGRGTLDRYPDAGATALREAIAAHHGLEADRIVYGTGSDEVLQLLAAGAFAGPGDEVIYVRYGFAVYPIAARRVGATPVVAPDSDYATDVDALLAHVTERTRVVYLANPNNPTGTYRRRARCARLHAGLPADCLLVLDHAYAEYIDEPTTRTAFALARDHANVLATRTFSKIYGLAAERIGWGYGAARVIAAMHRIRAPFNVTTAGQAAAIAALARPRGRRRRRRTT